MVVEYTFDELRKLITEEELDNLAKSLNKFLEVYFKYIYLNEKEVEIYEKIRRIKWIGIINKGVGNSRPNIKFEKGGIYYDR